MEKDAQKKNGIPRLILARVLPRGGKAEFPVFIKVNMIPKAVPIYIDPIPSVSSIIVVDIDTDPSKKIPASKIKNHIIPP